MKRQPFTPTLAFLLGALAITACGVQKEPTHPGAFGPTDTSGQRANKSAASYRGGSKGADAAPNSSAAENEWLEPQPGTRSGDSASEAPAPASAGKRRSPNIQPESAPVEPQPFRPGLATSWGETRRSSVRFVSFERQSEHPAFVSKVFYNDREGIEAMLDASHREFRTASEPDTPVTVHLVDAHGAPLPSWQVDNHRYVIAEEDDRYLIRIDNHTGRRLEAVASVDGLDVIDGQAASFDNRGYLVGPWASVTIDGFRQSADTVAAFRFGAVDESYAASKGTARNVGVIGVAIFPERGRPFNWREELQRRRSADPFPGEFAEPPRWR